MAVDPGEVYCVAMTLVIPLGYAHVVHSLRFSTDPEPMAITYGVDIDTPTFAGTANDIAEELADAAEAELFPIVSGAVSMVATEVRWQNTALPNPPVIGISSEAATGGDAASTILPQNSAYLVHKRTATGGRGGRGRMYIPGIDEAKVDNLGNITTAALGLWNTALDDWLAAIQATSSVVDMVVLHDSEGAHAGDDPRPVTDLQMDPRIATQRRRLRP